MLRCKAGTIQILNGAKLTAKGEAKAVDGTLSVNPLENYMIYAGDRETKHRKAVRLQILPTNILVVEPKNGCIDRVGECYLWVCI